MDIPFYPKEDELKTLATYEGVAVSVYHNFPLVNDWRERWKVDMLALLHQGLNETELSHEERAKLAERVATELEGVSLSRASVALFVSEEGTFLYNTFSEMVPFTCVGDSFSLVQLLRSISNPRRGYTLLVGKDDWSLWHFTGPEAPKEVSPEKSGIGSFGEFTAEVVSKHIVQRTKEELNSEHLRRYAKGIAEIVRPLVGNDELLVAGDASLVHDVRQGLPHAHVLERNATHLDVEAVSHELWDKLYVEALGREFARVASSTSAGLSLKDLSDLAAAVSDSNVERIFVQGDYEELGSRSGKTISLNGETPLVSSLLMEARENGAEIHVVKPSEITDPFWNGKLVAQRRWSYLG